MKDLTLKEKCLAYTIIVWPVGALLCCWYNYIYIKVEIAWYFYYLLGIVLFFGMATHNVIKKAQQILFLITLLLQVLVWASVITLPIIKK